MINSIQTALFVLGLICTYVGIDQLGVRHPGCLVLVVTASVQLVPRWLADGFRLQRGAW